MLSRDVDKARDAFKKKSIEEMRKAHQAEATEDHRQNQGKYIGSIVYGGLDGIITTFAVVAGVAGAELSSGIVLILGFANLVGDGISMAIGDFLSTKAEREYEDAERTREAWEVENYPDGEKKELVELYMDKGLPKEDAELITNTLSKHKKAWVDVMMVEELGIVHNDESPLKNAVATFISFAVFGFVPLLTFVLAQFIPVLKNQAFLLAAVLAGATLFTLGSLKVKLTGKNWFKSGLEMFAVGGIAAAAAYLIGVLLSGLA